MPRKIYCPYCKSLNIQHLFDNSLKCVNCKRVWFPKQEKDKRKLTGDGMMALLMVFAGVIQLFYDWLQVTKSWNLGIPIYLVGVLIMSLGFGKAITMLYRKYSK